MEFFSTLKTAYDSIGSEVSKSFDSTDFERESTGGGKAEPVAVVEPEASSAAEHKTRRPSDESSLSTTAQGDEERIDSWGQWEEKTTSTIGIDHTHSEQPSVMHVTTPTIGIDHTHSEQPSVRPVATPTIGLDHTHSEQPSVRPVATSTPAKPGQSKGKLEALSREDLIKYIKKQAQLLQRSKTRCEELTRECDEMKTTPTPTEAMPTPTEATPTHNGMLEELQIVRSERDHAVHEGKSLKQEKQELTDQVQMLREANSKLKVFCQENQSRQTEMEDLQRASEEITTKLSRENIDLASQLSQLKEELETVRDENRKLEEEKEEKRTEEADKEEKKMPDDVLEGLLRERTSQLTSLETQHTQLLAEYQELMNGNETLTEQLSDSNTKIDELQTQYQHLEKDTFEKTQAELEASKLTIRNLEGQLTEVKGHLEAVKSEKKSDQDNHREETKKLKAFVLKLKRELKETETASGGSEEVLRSKVEEGQVAMDTLTVEKQELASRLSAVENQKQTLDKQNQELASALSQQEDKLEELTREREGLIQRVGCLEEGQEVMKAELASAQADLATAHSHGNAQQLNIDELRDEVESVRGELTKEQEAHSEMRDQLAAARKGAQSSALMDLELQDYQRSIRSLEEDVAGRKEELEAAYKENHTHQEKIEQLRKELESAGSQRESELDTVTKLKALLVRNKRELAEGRRKEAELGERVDELEGELERGRGQEEETKVELSELSARLHSEQLASQSSLDTLQQTKRAQELKIATLQSQLSTAQTSLTLVQGDYDSYKVRVHSVLKQKSTPAGHTDINPEIKKGYEDEIATLKATLQDTKAQLTLTLSDHDELLSEHDALASRHDNLLQETQATREKLSLRLRETEAVYSRETGEQQALIQQLRDEIDDLTAAFTNQIAGLQQEHKKVVLSLREELHSSHTQLSRLQEEVDSRTLARVEARGVVKGRGLSLNMPSDGPPSEARTSGVGMDRAVLESSHPPTPISRQDSTVSLERLLSLSTDPKTEGFSETELAFQQQLHSSNKKIDHLTELLRESEASSGRLSEQAKLLKEEIRRLERNREREGISNMEYLKNVVLKFLHTRDVKEKEGLVPVVTKLLQLSPQEVKFIQEVIQGDDEDLPGTAMGPPALGGGATTKLTNYIHRWTGY